jgi:hypothetical protein
MDYDEFADRFLAAVYLETERENRTIVQAASILEKYNLQPKPNWISRMADDWEYTYFKKIYKTLGGYDGWSFSISSEGYRKVEADFADENEVAEFLGGEKRNDIDGLIDQVAPASDRLIQFTDNQDLSSKLVDGINAINSKLDGSNQLDPDEKADVAVSLNAAISMFQKSKSFLVGAFRYLVLERVKKAFEKSIEDVIRLAVLGLLATLVPLILAAVL